MTTNSRVRLLPALAVMFGLLFGGGSAWAQDYTVNLKDTDIQELIKFVAEVTGATIVVDPAVKGKVKVVSTRPVSASELYELFLSILEVHGYTAVRSGDVVRVIPSKDARSSPVAVRDEATAIRTEEYMTQVIRLENISAAKLIPVLRPLVPQQAHMAAYAPSNAIIISDVASNIDKISSIIDRMDKSAVQQTDIIKLRYAVADDVVKMLDKLNKSEAKQSGGEPEVLLVADSRTNSVLVSGDEIERARLRKLINHLDTPLEQSGNVKVIYLEYAEATEIADVLTRVMKNISDLEPAEGSPARRQSDSATIEADEGTNALIITADTDEMAALEAVIHRLDIRRAQVLVEAIIVEMEVIDGQDLGLQWLFADSNGSFGSNVNANDARTRNLANAIFPGQDNAASNQDNDFSLTDVAGALAGTPGLSFGWGQIDDSLTMVVILNALKERQNANILSTPSILTLDNQEAFITVGQNVPFVTGSFTNTGGAGSSVNPFQTIERQNVGITLTVTPHINEGDAVVLDISQEVSSLSGLSVAASDLITNERMIQTKVLAIDGEIVVLGGLIKDDVQDAQQKVPFLGDIPYLGRLFRSDREKVTKQNLMIFLRPTIIRDNKQLAGATAQKYSYIRDQQALRKAQGLLYLDDQDIPELPEWESQIQQLKTLSAQQSGADGPGAPTPPAEAP